ncbi:MAG: tetratricopeptide repeat protein [Prevotella sp.]|nr:tetratricopeptide repeat protein [Prevotella sp.]
MEIAALIKHPEMLDRDTLYELRSTLALHPYYQTARLLMLHNLYLLHDASFDEELRKAALYVTDRKVMFNMIEAAHYRIRNGNQNGNENGNDRENRTVALIDTFLDSIPPDEEEKADKKRKPTPADAAVDYVAYLLASEDQEENTEDRAPQMKGQDLIDTFLEQEQGRIMLAELPTSSADTEQPADNGERESEDTDEEYFTETLARIYIKQGRYQKALDIIGRLNEKFPQKNNYFADQMRFLEKLIINNNNNNKQ